MIYYLDYNCLYKSVDLYSKGKIRYNKKDCKLNFRHVSRRWRRREGEVARMIKTETHSVLFVSAAKRFALCSCLAAFLALPQAGCGSVNSPAASGGQGVPSGQSAIGSWDSAPKVLSPQSPGSEVLGEGVEEVKIDISNRAEGYIIARYTGDNDKAKLILRKAGGQSGDYIYDLTPGGYDVLPLSEGGGEYEISVNENIEGERYAVIFAETFSADIADEFGIYLYPNQYVNFSAQSRAALLAGEITAGASDVFGAVGNIYDYVVENIAYDMDKAERARQGLMAGYLPDVDQTLAQGSGICFDYAAAVTAMLRSQGVPARLVIGYSGQAYHAWVDVHIEGQGSVASIRFSGEDWVLMDPTYDAAYAAAGATAVGDGANYNPLYYY